MAYDLIAFDFDGTLADTFPWFAGVLDTLADRFHFHKAGAAEKEALRHREAREILRTLGVPLWKIPAIAAYTRRLMLETHPVVPLFEGMGQALEKIGATGATLAVVSSNSLENVQRALGADTAALIGRYECGTDLFGKSAKLKRLVKHLAVPAERAILVGDEIRDIDAARAASISVGAVAWGYNYPQALAARHPDQLFMSVNEMTAFFVKRGGQPGEPRAADGAADDGGAGTAGPSVRAARF